MPARADANAKPASTSRVTTSRTPSLRSGLRQFTRQRLLDAALQCFREQGYQNTTVDRLVDVAGTTVTTFYRHYDSKADLLQPLLNHLIEEVEATLRILDALDSTSRIEIRRWLDAYMVMWTRLNRLCAAHWEAAGADREYAAKLMDGAIECASVMESALSRLEPASRVLFKIRLGLMTMYLDRMALVVSVERDAARAHVVLDEMSKMLWLVLNDDAVLAL